MSNTKHTPGPWTLKGEAINHPESGKPMQIVKNVKLVGGYDITAVAYGRTLSEAAANAKLIAAAPEFLDVAERMSLYGDESFLTQFDNIDQLIEAVKSLAKKAKAAIQKATE